MLGKGLESLIPPQKGQGDDGTHNPAPFEPQIHSTPPPQFLPHEPKPILMSEMASTRRAEPIDPPEPAPRHFPVHKERPIPPVPPRSNRVEQQKPSQEDYIFHIEVEKIKPNPSQPRRHFEESALRDLASSIREFGFLQPLVVTKIEHETPTGVDVEYELIAGERRLMASKLLGLTQVPAIVRNVHLEREKLELAVIENIQRENLNPIETARALARLQDEFRLTQREIAAKLGKSREAVANTVRLLSLPMYIQEALEKSQISESHGRLLLAVDDQASQKKLFDDIMLRGMTTRELKTRVQAARPRKLSAHEALPPEVKMMEEKLTMELGTPVKIEHAAGTGKIVITFYSEEELENLVHKIGKEEN